MLNQEMKYAYAACRHVGMIGIRGDIPDTFEKRCLKNNDYGFITDFVADTKPARNLWNGLCDAFAGFKKF